jgi:hypothetical protein
MRRLQTERQAAEDQDRPSRRLPSRMQRAVDRWSEESGHVANGLAGATVTVPPSRQRQDVRGGSGPSNPTAGVLDAVLAAVDREAQSWAHLAGRCDDDGRLMTPDDGEPYTHVCPYDTVQDLARILDVDIDCTQVVDGMLGTPPTSTIAWRDIVSHTASWHTQTSTYMLDAFRARWGTCERVWAEDVVTRTEQLANRMATIAGRLAQWSTRTEASCTGCGGMKPADGNVCGRCRTAKWRAKSQAAS